MRGFIRLGAAAVMLVALACDSTEPVGRTAIALSQTSVVLDAIGATATIGATVTDQNGTSTPDVPVSWTSTGASITLNAAGASVVVTAAANGNAVVTATAQGISTSIPVTVTQAVAGPQKLAGDVQSGRVGSELSQPLQVRVQDRLGSGIGGQTVAFSVSSGGGTVTPVSVVSDANGIASARWTMGTNTAVPNVVSADVAGTSVSFTATATAGPAISVVMNAGNNQAATVGTVVATPPSVRVFDSFSNPVPSTVVTFAVTSGGGSATGSVAMSGANGIAAVGSWRLGTTPGGNTITATAGSLLPVSFAANALTGPAASLAIVAGNNQATQPGTSVPIRPTVQVADQYGNPVAGASVNFAVTSGGGSVSGSTVTTDASGIAAATGWSVGSTLGPNTLSATVSGAAFAGNAAVFTAFAAPASQFGIALRFTTPFTQTQTSAFAAAASRWASIILDELPDQLITIPAGRCSPNSPSLQAEVVDDVLIFATIEAIDGPGGLVGVGGQCVVRAGTNFVAIGQIRFDLADIAALEANGTFEVAVLHEMGHVLGIGNQWATRGLVTNPTGASAPRESIYNGQNGIDGFNAIGGTSYTGPKVPVENTGGSAVTDKHWREAVLGRELMSGFLNAGANPLSVLTIRSLQDIGYTVQTVTADPFFLNLSLTAGTPGPVVDLRNDVFDGPLYSIDAQGRIRQIK
jgi:hypothetical protein